METMNDRDDLETSEVLLTLAKAAGMPLARCKSRGGMFCWDGKKYCVNSSLIDIVLDPSSLETINHEFLTATRIANFVHEVAHYLVATEFERSLPEFGLGNSPFLIKDYNKPRLSKHPDVPFIREDEASVLQCILMYHLRLNFTVGVSDSLGASSISHYWEDAVNFYRLVFYKVASPQIIEDALMSLYDRNIIDDEGPVVLRKINHLVKNPEMFDLLNIVWTYEQGFKIAKNVNELFEICGVPTP